MRRATPSFSRRSLSLCSNCLRAMVVDGPVDGRMDSSLPQRTPSIASKKKTHVKCVVLNEGQIESVTGADSADTRIEGAGARVRQQHEKLLRMPGRLGHFCQLRTNLGDFNESPLNVEHQ